MKIEYLSPETQGEIKELNAIYSDPVLKKEFRAKIMALEHTILSIPGTTYGDQPDCPLKHSFGDGIYVREIFMPKGKLIVSKIHKYEHPYFVLKGVVSVLTENGPQLIVAPYHGMTPRATKRALYIHEDTIWITVHASKQKDPKDIEEEIIAKDFTECLPEPEEMKEIEGVLL